MFPGLYLYCTDPAQHMITAGEDIDDLHRDLSVRRVEMLDTLPWRSSYLCAPLCVESDSFDYDAGPLQQPLRPRGARVQVVRLPAVQTRKQVVASRIEKDLVDRVLLPLGDLDLCTHSVRSSRRNARSFNPLSITPRTNPANSIVLLRSSTFSPNVVAVVKKGDNIDIT